MKFQTQVIPIEEQIKYVESVIDDYKTLVQCFKADEDIDLQEKTFSDLAMLIAMKYSLRRLLMTGTKETEVAMPVAGRCMNRSETCGKPVEVTRTPKTLNETWEQNLVTPGILRKLDAERLGRSISCSS